MTVCILTCIPLFDAIWLPKVKSSLYLLPPHADWKSGEVLGQQSPQNISGASTTEVVGDCKKKNNQKNITWLHNVQLVWRNPSFLEPRDPKLVWKDLFTPFLRLQIFNVAAQMKVLAGIASEVSAHTA